MYHTLLDELFETRRGFDFFDTTRGIADSAHETEKEFVIDIELPGFDRESISVEITDKILKVKAEKKKPEGLRSLLSNISYGKYEKDYKIVTPVKADDITAKYSDGVLNIVIPKKEEVYTKKISIH